MFDNFILLCLTFFYCLLNLINHLYKSLYWINYRLILNNCELIIYNTIIIKIK